MPFFTEAHFLNQLGITDPALRDDTFLTPHGQLFTTDTMVEGTHFSWDYFFPADIGWKAIAVNASDIAATGGLLDGVLISLTVPPHTETEMVEGLYQGIHDMLASLPGLPVIFGGDTTAGPCWVIGVTAIGHIPAGYTPGRRWNAKPGDNVLTTGPHGLSALGLKKLNQHVVAFPWAKQAHLRPTPRWAEGQRLAQVGCRYALMDSSDGLADAALKLAQASQVSIELWADHLPTHPELLLAEGNPLDLMLYGGEDFELVACWPPDKPIPEGFTLIGKVVTATTPTAWVVPFSGGAKIPLDAQKMFQHFI